MLEWSRPRPVNSIVGLLTSSMKRFIVPSLVAMLIFSLGVVCVGVWLKHRYSTTRPPLNSQVPSDTFITLERTGCYGTCPTYTVAVSGDGTVVFSAFYFAKVNGVNQWKKSGVIKSHISDEQVRQLVAEFDRANYFSLQDFYRDAKDGCPAVETDQSSAYTSIQLNGRKKSIQHYLGCLYEGRDSVTYPKELVALETAIDQIVDSKQWMQ